MLTQVAPQPLRGGEAMGFRELLYFRVVGCLGEQGVRLTPEQKREIFTAFGRRRKPTQGSWLRREGQLVMCGAVPLSMDLSKVSRELRYRYRLLQRPQRCGGAQSCDLLGAACIQRQARGFPWPWLWSSFAPASAEARWKRISPSSAGRPSITRRSRHACPSLPAALGAPSPCNAAEGSCLEAVDRRKSQSAPGPLGL